VPIFVLIAYKEVPVWKAALAGALGSCLTHPLLWFWWRTLFLHHGYSFVSYIVTGELIVGTVESITFFALARPIRLSRAVSASFIANAGSYGLGALFRYLDVFL